MPKVYKKTVLWFGKHKGQTVNEVLNEDAQYLFWMYQNIDNIEMDEKLLKEIDVKKHEQYIPRQTGRSWFNADEISNYDERQLDCGEGYTW